MPINDIVRGNSKTYKFVFTNIDRSVKDITGWQILFMAKVNINDADGAALIDVTATAGNDTNDDPPNGLMYLTVPETATELTPQTLSYDFVRIIPGATPDIKTLDQGSFAITKAVRQNAN